MPPKLRSRDYAGDKIVVRYDIRRCIHAEECIHGLPDVFDKDGRPWIQPDAATADQVAQTILRCPTGALKFERLDGGNPEATPERNVIYVVTDGPLYVLGDIRITDRDGNVLHQDSRVALCRCGVSKNRPFCDNSHLEIDFKATGLAQWQASPPEGQTGGDGPLQITPSANGSFGLEGNFEIVGKGGEVLLQADRAYLCRCGASQEKPFCDKTHNQIGFQAEIW